MGSRRTALGTGGRIIIPAEYRRALGIRVGDPLILQLEDGELRVLTPRQAIKRAQEILRPYTPRDRSLVDELIAERRLDAERE